MGENIITTSFIVIGVGFIGTTTTLSIGEIEGAMEMTAGSIGFATFTFMACFFNWLIKGKFFDNKRIFLHSAYGVVLAGLISGTAVMIYMDAAVEEIGSKGARYFGIFSGVALVLWIFHALVGYGW